MNWPSSVLADWAIQLQDMIETHQFGEHTPRDCRRCKADRIYSDLRVLAGLCENHEKKESTE